MIFDIKNVRLIKKKRHLGKEVEYLEHADMKFSTSKIEGKFNNVLILDIAGEYINILLTDSLKRCIDSVNWEDSGTVEIFTVGGISRITSKSMVPIYRSAAYEDDFTDPDYFGEGFDHS